MQETHVVGGQSYVTAYAYDLANHVVQVTYPSGRIVGYTRDAMGRISGVATQANSSAVPVAVASSAAYAPFGPLTSLAYGNGLGLSVSYDQDYQPSARLVAGASSVQDLAYGVDADGNITGITDHLAAARSQIFQYDALNRLTYASGLYGALAYGYDAVGNRTSQSGGTTNLAETYTYAANSNQLLSVANGGTTRSLGYTPTGNLATDNRGSGTALSFTYDLSDRRVQVANQNQPLASYAYNFMGQRVAKTTSSTITHFLYDRAGYLLADSNGATGAAQTEYIWLGDMPLALVTNGTLYFIHPDHLNTPQKATDAGQNLAWDAVLRPFGQTEQQTFPSLTNLRFPGQYFDAEDGLHQNWFRDYDPNLGRYIESDLIGLRGGVNLYSYVSGNPARSFDSSGLCKVEVRFFKLGLGWYHAYVVTTDPNGSQTYFRGGPSGAGPSGGSPGQLSGATSGSDSWGPIITNTGPYVPGTVDYQTGHPPSVTVHDDNEPCTCIDEKFAKSLKDIEAAKIPYNPFGPNSNSVARGVIQGGGFPAPTPPVWVPGWNKPLAM